MPSLGILDAGPLIAWPVRTDPNHASVVAILERADLRFVIPALVVAEAAYVLGDRFGPRVESALIRGLVGFEIVLRRTPTW